jgi:hypothetical protein
MKKNKKNSILLSNPVQPDRYGAVKLKNHFMKDYLLVFRTDYSKMPKASPEEMQAMAKKWMDWFGSIAAQGKLAERGNRLVPMAGKVVRPDNVVTDGPYMEIKESLGGYATVKANSLDEAAELAKNCPVFGYGGNVEVREIMTA